MADSDYVQSYEISPITLIGGSAAGVVGGAMGITNLLLGAAFTGLTSPGGSGAGPDVSDYNVTFMPLQGGTVIDNQLGTYPYANTAIAANAVINQPLAVSILMRIPATAASGGYSGRAALFQGFVSTLQQHTVDEGTFVVNTPMYPWVDAILVRVTDVSGGDSKQPQIEWKLDFQIPLVSAQSDDYSTNDATSSVDNGGTTDGTASGDTPDSSAAVPNNTSSPGAGVDTSSASSGPQFDTTGPSVSPGPGGNSGFGISGAGSGIDATSGYTGRVSSQVGGAVAGGSVG